MLLKTFYSHISLFFNSEQLKEHRNDQVAWKFECMPFFRWQMFKGAYPKTGVELNNFKNLVKRIFILIYH